MRCFCSTDEEARRGVVTHSSGNHAAALARAAKLRGIPAYIVMPNNAPKAKQASVRRYGGRDHPVRADARGARKHCTARVIADTGATFIHPYNDLRVMAGQGTTALELLEDVPDLDIILCPVGGGGHLSGVAVAAKGSPDIRVIGVEPAGCGRCGSFVRRRAHHPQLDPKTIADGLRTSLGEQTFAEIQQPRR